MRQDDNKRRTTRTSTAFARQRRNRCEPRAPANRTGAENRLLGGGAGRQPGAGVGHGAQGLPGDPGVGAAEHGAADGAALVVNQLHPKNSRRAVPAAGRPEAVLPATGRGGDGGESRAERNALPHTMSFRRAWRQRGGCHKCQNENQRFNRKKQDTPKGDSWILQKKCVHSCKMSKTK